MIDDKRGRGEGGENQKLEVSSQKSVFGSRASEELVRGPGQNRKSGLGT